MRKYIFPAFCTFVVVATVWFCSYVLYNSKYDAYCAAYLAMCEDLANKALADGEIKVKVSIDCNVLEYHHLGDDVICEHTCNGVSVSDGDVITAKERMRFETKITEQDNIPDTGRSSYTFMLPPFSGEQSIKIRVNEEGGTRYENAYAVFEVTCKIEPLENPILAEIEKPKIRYWAVVFS